MNSTRNSGAWVRPALITAAAFYLLLAVGPLAGLFLYAPLGEILTPTARAIAAQSLVLTLKCSIVATALSFVFGLPAALCLARLQFRGKAALDALVEIPIALPPVVMGVALLLTWGRRGVLGQMLADAGQPLSFTTTAVVIAQFVVASPYFVRIAKTAIQEVPRSLEEASLSLGAGPLRTYQQVTLPLARAGILAALLTCWARAMGEFGASILFAGNFAGRTQTIPLAIFTTMQYDLEASIALSLMMITFSLLAFVGAQLGLSAAHRRTMGTV